jgi:hypothetical protein
MCPYSSRCPSLGSASAALTLSATYAILSQLETLTEIDVSPRFKWRHQLKKLLPVDHSLHRLEHIAMEDSYLDDEAMEALLRISSSLTSLHSFGSWRHALLSSFVKLQSLKSSFDPYDGIAEEEEEKSTTNSADSLIGSLAQCGELTSLTMRDARLTRTQATRLLTSIPKLQVLTIITSNVPLIAFADAAAALPDGLPLHSLAFHSCLMRPPGLVHLRSAQRLQLLTIKWDSSSKLKLEYFGVSACRPPSALILSLVEFAHDPVEEKETYPELESESDIESKYIDDSHAAHRKRGVTAKRKIACIILQYAHNASTSLGRSSSRDSYSHAHLHITHVASSLSLHAYHCSHVSISIHNSHRHRNEFVPLLRCICTLAYCASREADVRSNASCDNCRVASS